MYTESAVSYNGRKILLLEKLGRELTDEEQGCILSYELLQGRYLAEAEKLANISALYAILYLQYIMVPRLVDLVSMYVYEVLIGKTEINAWLAKWEK